MTNWIKSFLRHDIVRNSLWMFAGRGVRIVIQAVYFVLIARTLKVDNYGAFVATLALVAILAPFATIGSGNILIKNVARDRSTFAHYWGRALFLTVSSAVVLTALVMVIAPFVLPRPLTVAVVLPIALSDLLFFRLIEVCGQAFQSVERLDCMAALYVSVSLLRLIGVVVLASVVHAPSIDNWALVYMMATLIAAICAVYAVTRMLGSPAFSSNLNIAELREGAYFCVSLSAQTVYNDLDKTMLARMSTLEAAGIYGIAYRLIDVSFTPVGALLYATYTSFFKLGESGIGASAKFAKRILPRVGAYGLLVWVAIFVCSSKLPLLLGPGYSGAVDALRWLAPIPLLRGLHYFLSDALTGAGYQGFRTAAQCGVAILNVSLNLWLLPSFGWRGAAWSSIASDGILLTFVATIVWILNLREGQKLQPSAA